MKSKVGREVALLVQQTIKESWNKKIVWKTKFSDGMQSSVGFRQIFNNKSKH